jgi:hypothetical protein
MNKQLVMIGLIVLVVCVSLSGCTQDTLSLEKNKFVGTWKSSTLGDLSTLNVYSNGTWTSTLSHGTWDVKDGKFILVDATTGLSNKYTYTFSNSDTTLQVTGQLGVTTIYNKQ